MRGAGGNRGGGEIGFGERRLVVVALVARGSGGVGKGWSGCRWQRKPKASNCMHA